MITRPCSLISWLPPFPPVSESSDPHNSHLHFTYLVTSNVLFLRLSLQVGMDELENQTIQMWRDPEKAFTSLKSTLVQIDLMQR